MEIKSVLKNTLGKWGKRTITITDELLYGRTISKKVQSHHLWIIAALMVFGAFIYYIDQTPLASVPFFNHHLFTGVHDTLRLFFIIPIIGAAVVLRVQGALIISFLSLCIILQRALFFSPYPDPVIRSLIFIAFAALIGLLIATQLNEIEKEKKLESELNKADKELSKFQNKFKESQQQLAQADKLTSLGQLAASIAHEVNNPISGVLVYTQLLTKKIASDRFVKKTALEYLSKMEKELIRSARLIQNLLNFARQSPPKLRTTSINDVISRTLELTAHPAKLQNVEVIKDLEHSLSSIMVDSDQIQQVCFNLILNAIQAMPNGGRLNIRTSSHDNWLKIEVQDTGYGIPEEKMSKLFTPFFTTKGRGQGVGLGLAVAYGIIHSHNGRIEVQSREGVGTTFTVGLPMNYEEKD
ncbi:MAG: sensor histidine kinase [Candidatus Sifarchaeia archaeon]|jgi:signal transduction histidine kinase